MLVISLSTTATVRTLEHEFIYGRWIVPQLPELLAVPWTWWLAEITITLLLLLVIGMFARGPRELLAAACGASLGWFVFQSWAALTLQPGFHKADSRVALLSLPLGAVGAFLVLTLGAFLRRIPQFFVQKDAS